MAGLLLVLVGRVPQPGLLSSLECSDPSLPAVDPSSTLEVAQLEPVASHGISFGVITRPCARRRWISPMGSRIIAAQESQYQPRRFGCLCASEAFTISARVPTKRQLRPRQVSMWSESLKCPIPRFIAIVLPLRSRYMQGCRRDKQYSQQVSTDWLRSLGAVLTAFAGEVPAGSRVSIPPAVLVRGVSTGAQVLSAHAIPLASLVHCSICSKSPA